MTTVHLCNLLPHSDHVGYGPAITSIWWDEGAQEWFASNGEYHSTIRFCPFCGVKLEPPTALDGAV